MAARTRLKILTTSSTTSAPSILKTGELAYSYESVSAGQGQAGERLYVGVGAEDAGTGIASGVQTIGGKYFTDLLDHSHGALTASSALITDSNSKLAQLKVDNLDLNGNTLSSTDTNGNIVIDPNGTGKLVLHNPYINGTSVTLEEFIFDTVGGAVTGGTGITVTNDDGANTSTVSITNTGVSAGSVGSATAVPVLTINAQGQITAASTATISTTLDIAADSGTDNGVAIGTDTLTISGTSNEIETSVSGDTITVGLVDNPTVGGNLTITGNLVVNGNTTTVNSTTITIDDPIFTLGGDTAPGSDDGKDRGIEFRYHDGSNAKLGFFGFDDSDSTFAFIPDATNTSEVFSGSLGNAKFAGVTADNVRIGITAANEIDTSSGNLVLDSAGGTVQITDHLDLDGNLDVSGTVTFANDLTVANGGTGRSSFTDNGVVYGDGANALDVTAAGSQFDILQAGAGGVPVFSAIIDGGTY